MPSNIAPRPGFAAVALFGCALVLAACGTDDTVDDEPEQPEVRVVVPDEPTGCPRVVVLRDAAQAVEFRPGGSDLTDMVARATFGDFEGGCEYYDEGVTVNLTLTLFSELGPAARSREAEFQYFVAILDPQQTVLEKEVFATTFTFPEGRNVVAVPEDVIPRIPLDRLATGPAYNVVLGFQLSEEQLDYNRRR
jgi:hypothetical protein